MTCGSYAFCPNFTVIAYVYRGTLAGMALAVVPQEVVLCIFKCSCCFVLAKLLAHQIESDSEAS